MSESSSLSATGGEENWERMVRLLRDERCVGRADLMADAAKMIERLVGYLDKPSAASETKACPLCHGYSSEHCFVSVCPMKGKTTPSETPRSAVVESLIGQLRKHVSHNVCEDAWYSCSQADCADDRRAGHPCDCGAQRLNELHAHAADALERTVSAIRCKQCGHQEAE